MPQDSYREITNESWFSRIRSALSGMLCGLLFFLAAFPLLFWNEGRAVKRHKTLQEGAGSVITVDANRINPKNSGKLVHIIAKANTDAMLEDPDFGINVKALKLKRIVEMYQWQESSQSETQKKIGGGTETVTTYTYNKIWSDRPISSTAFKKSSGHQNPEHMPYQGLELVADDIHLGAFTLSPALVSKFNTFSALPITDDTALPPEIKKAARRHDRGLFFGQNPMAPQIGDLRIHFKAALPMTVSIIAKQDGQSFAPYKTQAGGTIELLQTGSHQAEAMIEKAKKSNMFLTWGIRLAGFILMALGLAAILRPLGVLADVVPLLGNIIHAGTGLISALTAAALSLLTIAIAWIVYRPVWGIILAAIALAVTLTVKVKLKSKSPAPAFPPPPPAT